LLFFEHEKDLKRAVDLLDSLFKRYNLNINATKTKTMIMNHQYEKNETDYPDSIASLNKKKIENVAHYTYLGCEIEAKECNIGEMELNLRIDAGENKFYSLSHKFFNKKINLKIRVMLLNSLVRSRMVHACQTWIMTKRQMDKINSVYYKMIRKMTKRGFRRNINSWSFVNRNEDLLRMANFVGKNHIS